MRRSGDVARSLKTSTGNDAASFSVDLLACSVGHRRCRWLFDLAGLRDLAGRRGANRSRTWPQDSVIPLDGRRSDALMFLHPFCPCSSASVDELSEILGSLVVIGSPRTW